MLLRLATSQVRLRRRRLRGGGVHGCGVGALQDSSMFVVCCMCIVVVVVVVVVVDVVACLFVHKHVQTFGAQFNI
jgi:predicted metalloprotease